MIPFSPLHHPQENEMVPGQAFLHEALEFSLQKIRATLASVAGFPELTGPDGKWVCVEDGGWVGGHWTGLLWLALAHTGDPALEQAARHWTARLAPRQLDTTTHDLGFLFELSHRLGWQLTGDETLKGPVVQASRTMTRRFNVPGSYFQAWGPLDAVPELRGRAIVDTMMNLDMLFWASQETGEPQFRQMALAHAKTVLARHLRPDGSTSHTIDFDPDTGAFLRQDTHQGLSGASCWSRGQAWAVYGCAETFRATADPRFLESARRLAEYALARLPQDLVPYWDYDSPLIPADVRDSSAAAILASGLLLLACLETDAALATRWQETALGILASLWEAYTSRGRREESILVHGTRSKPHGSQDHGLIYGDYYFVEALTRLLKPDMEL
jgi:unsaturated chondroitin disaccharide hydrolase